MSRSIRQIPFLFSWLLSLLPFGKAHAEDQLDYRYEFYGEENGRIRVDTHSVFVEKQIIDAITARGELIYDGISGATPTGSPPLLLGSNTKDVPLADSQDIRRAANLALACRWGPQTITPQIAYSEENDYKSIGLSLSDAIEFNQKNTTLLLGVAHNFDKIQPAFFAEARRKDTWDYLIGVTQLLTPKTVVSANFTYGTDSGYLSDPYKNVRFDGWLPDTFIFPEKRPHDRDREVLLLTLTQHVEPLKGSAEVSYRFYHDTFDVFAHTAALTWHQKIGRYVILEPTFRYYEQSAASFYRLSVPGFVPTDGDPARPDFYSADYRLSHFRSFTYGVQAVVRVVDRVSIDLGYQRYVMQGLDHRTDGSAYPKANVLNAGVRIWF